MDQLFNVLAQAGPVSVGLRHQLTQITKHRKLPKKDGCLLKAGQLSLEMCLVTQGGLRGEIEKGEQKLSSRFMLENEIVFNVESFLFQTPSTESIYTLETTEILYLTRDEFYHIGKVCPELFELAFILSQQSQSRANKRFNGLRDLDNEGKVLWLAENEPEWVQRVPDKYLASFLDMSPITYSRINARLVNK